MGKDRFNFGDGDACLDTRANSTLHYPCERNESQTEAWSEKLLCRDPTTPPQDVPNL